MSNWCTIESDPGVFTELISQIGVKGVQVEEVYDFKNLNSIKPCFGLIFLFKWQEEKDNRHGIDGLPDVFFAKQVISNACATQAIISVLMNRPEVDLGEELSTFKSFTKDLPSDIRGLAISNSDLIRTAHNSFARPEPFQEESKATTGEDDDVYHFIGYVPVNGMLYELDGLKNGPILLGECNMENWLEAARPAIQQRIDRYSQKEIRFNLLGLVRNRKEVFQSKMSELQKVREAIQSRLNGQTVTDSAIQSASPTDLKTGLTAVDGELGQLQQGVNDEEDRYRRWRAENIRRKHNYIPLVFNLLKALATRDKLKGLQEEATKANAARQTAATKRKTETKQQSSSSSSTSGSGGAGSAKRQ